MAELVDLSITEASKQIRSGEITSVELTRAYLDQIERLEPRINAFITVTDELALEQAEMLDQELKNGQWRGPMHGIPIALKDNINTAGILTTGASALFKDRVPETDAVVTERLRNSGSVLLGKLNMHEFAFGGTSSSTFYDPVHNPWKLDHIPGGSSGGSAAAVAARMCAGALGTDTAASIRMPASFCGIVGLKATYGLVSIRGIFPLSESLDNVGPMCRTVADTALMLQALAGYDAKDISSIKADIPKYMSAVGAPVKQMRLGIPEGFYFDDLQPDVKTAMDEAVKVLEHITSSTQQVTLPERPAFPPIISEAWSYHKEYLEDEANHALYTDETLGRLLDLEGIPRHDYIEAIRQLTLSRKAIDRVFEDVDVLITPTSPAVAHPIGEPWPQTNDVIPELTTRNTLPFNYYGIPTISVPCGFDRNGLPIGMQISGPRLGELAVLSLAHAYELATDWGNRKPPVS
jgi:aspartyl-tRNA(Asn)/glutamyl-tRNA(Gln) amidotransferase subunit A